LIKAMAKSVLNNNTGFTLVEVMVAIVVLTIGILGAGAMQVSVLNDNAGSYDMTEATALALDQVEDIMTWNYTDARLNDDNDTAYNRIGTGAGNLRIRTIATNGDLIAAASDNYTIYLDITNNTPVATNSKTIRVDVVWREGANLQTVSMNFIKLRIEPL